MNDGQVVAGDAEALRERGLQKLADASWKFDRARNGELLNTLECREMDKEIFRLLLKKSMNCRLTVEEMDAIMPDLETNGFVDGPKFLLLFYKFRFDKRNQMLSQKLKEDKRIREEEKKSAELREAQLERSDFKLVTDYTDADLKSGFAKIRDASVKYDKMMPGAVQTDAFEVECMYPHEFKEQAKRVFNMRFTPRELAAVFNHFDTYNSGQLYCAEFLVFFFRQGFEEKSKRIKEVWEKERLALLEREAKKKAELEEAEKKNALKCDFRFTEEDKTIAFMKLREAARLYNKNSTAAVSMKSFEAAYMKPHEFKEQLKRLFNLNLTAPQLGALMSIFDANGDGFITCQEFTKCFMAMGFNERAMALREERAKQKAIEDMRKEEEQKKLEEIAMKNSMKVNFDFSDADYKSAIKKLADAAWKYDKNLPGSPSLKAFEGDVMPPHVFKEQLRATLGIKLTAGELGALMTYFDANGDGVISCAEFLVAFIKTGFSEKFRRRQEYREYQLAKEEQREKAAAIKEYTLQQKNALKVNNNFTENDFTSAMSKLTEAARLYDRSMPGCIQLNAFDAESMSVSEFREQLKLVFGIKVNAVELGALVAYFDKYDEGCVNCAHFVKQFLRTGFEERDRVRKEYRALLKRREQYMQKLEEEKLKKEAARQLNEIDYEFTEEHFDSALRKLIHMCHAFDGRTLGPGGWKAFDSATLSPSEFKEMMKRTFNVHLNRQELGAMVTYFDTDMKGVVSCFHFLNCFVQMRVKIEGFKGKPNEEGNLAVYHSQLKEAYKNKMLKRVESNADELKTRPWRSAFSAAGGIDAVRARKEKGCSYPKTPLEKVKRRYFSARATGKMDLSTKTSWPEEWITIRTADDFDGPSRLGSGMTSPSVSRVTSRVNSPRGGRKPKSSEGRMTIVGGKKKLETEVQAAVRKNMRKIGIVVTDWVETDPLMLATRKLESVDEETPPRAPKGVLAFNEKAFDIRLGLIPGDVLKISYLKELWVDNNRFAFFPPEISQLRGLKILSAANCGLTSISNEVCGLRDLEQLLVPSNRISELPPAFAKLAVIKTLDISCNEFIVFPEVVCECTTLISLNISSTSIFELPMNFIQLRSLTFLHATNTCISEYPTVLNKLRTLFSVGIVDTVTTANGTVFQKENPEEEKENKKKLINKDRKNQKKLPEEDVYRPVAPVPIVPISIEDENEIRSFLKKRAMASNVRKQKILQGMNK